MADTTSRLTDTPEGVVTDVPLVYRRRIAWSDTDAARIVYTVRFFEFGMAAVEAWFRKIWGKHWYRMHVEQDVGTPFVHIDMDMRAPLVPDDIVDVRVLVERVGRSSLTFAVDGRRHDGADCFVARYTCSLVQMNPIRSMPIPADKRRLIDAYIAGCETA